MIVCLIGMSGSGKAYWSRKLADHGFQRIRCDGPIEELLQSEPHLGRYSGIRGAAPWMGQPDEPGYQDFSTSSRHDL